MDNLITNNVDLIDSVLNERINRVTERDSLKVKREMEQLKRDYFNETIHIYSTNEIEKEWRVQRLRLSKKFLQHLVDRALLGSKQAGAVVAYVKESDTGQIITPDNMQRLCKPVKDASDCSFSYELFLSYSNSTKDVIKSRNNSSYCGDMKFNMYNVPDISQNGLHKVETIHIRNWIIDGILKEEPVITQKETKIEEMKLLLNKIKKQLEQIPYEPVLNDQGVIISGKYAEKKREERFMLMERNIDQLHSRLDQSWDALEKTKQDLIGKLSIRILKQKHDACWEFHFLGDDKEYFEDIIVMKSNWNTSMMYANSNHHIVEEDNSFDEREYLVDTGGVLITRLEHGFGCFNKCGYNQDKIKDINNHVDAYIGSYKNGVRSGYGLLFSSTGIWGGQMSNDQPCGQGTQVAKDGDVQEGSFEFNISKLSTTSSYKRSNAEGLHKIQFSDGAYFHGRMEQGEFSGSGVYVSSKGDRMEGEFLNGCFVRGVKIESNVGKILKGDFENDLLDSEGSLECKSSRSIYKGQFVHGLKHGKGEEVSLDKNGLVLSRYNGFFFNGKRSGLGELSSFGVGLQDDKNNDKKDFISLKSFWLSGQPKAGGMVSKIHCNFANPTTSKSTSKFLWLHRFQRLQDKKVKKSKQRDMQLKDSDNSFRRFIERKKMKIFDAHRKSIQITLSGEKDQRIDSGKNAENKARRPSKRPYFTQTKINKGPVSIQEAIDQPGLRMIDRVDNVDLGTIRKLRNTARDKWIDKGFAITESFQISHVITEYNNMEEKWSTIDVERPNN